MLSPLMISSKKLNKKRQTSCRIVCLLLLLVNDENAVAAVHALRALVAEATVAPPKFAVFVDVVIRVDTIVTNVRDPMTQELICDDVLEIKTAHFALRTPKGCFPAALGYKIIDHQLVFLP